jgi:hypothetical protein
VAQQLTDSMQNYFYLAEWIKTWIVLDENISTVFLKSEICCVPFVGINNLDIGCSWFIILEMGIC